MIKSMKSAYFIKGATIYFIFGRETGAEIVGIVIQCLLEDHVIRYGYPRAKMAAPTCCCICVIHATKK